MMMSDETLQRADFTGVIQRELDEIGQRRRFRGQEPAQANRPEGTAGAGQKTTPSKEEKPSWEARCHQRRLFGICISGGGIRSATFALGVLQALAGKRILQKADYVSTVSGGGYIGSWLQGVLKRPADPQEPYEPLTRTVPKEASKDRITFLRKYSNYLAPRHGFSIDTLLIPMIWSRNMILNQVIIIAAFMAAFLPAFLPGTTFLSIINSAFVARGNGLVLVAASVVAAVAVLFMARNLSRIAIRELEDLDENGSGDQAGRWSAKAQAFADATREGWRTRKAIDYRPGRSTSYVVGFVVVPVFASILLMMSALYSGSTPNSFADLFELVNDIKNLAGLFALFFLLQAFGGFQRCYRRRQWAMRKPGRRAMAFWHTIWMSAACASFTWFLLKLVTWLFWQWLPNPAGSYEFGSQLAIAYAPPLYVLALMSGIVLQLGLMGQDFPDGAREWLARAGTLFWTTGTIWAGYFTLAVFVPFWIATVYHMRFGTSSLASVITAWLGSTTAAVLAGKSAQTDGTASQNGAQKSTKDEKSKKTEKKKPSFSLDTVARYGPFVAIGGFLILLAFLTQWLLHFASGSECGCNLQPQNIGALSDPSYWVRFSVAPGCWYWPLGLFAGAVFIFSVLSWRVNINEFSMHHFYKNRLVRCYLGASAIGGVGEQDRQADWFTGFDPKDDVALKKLRFAEEPTGAPYPILNATVNVTAGTELATQERKGLPWFFTPWYSGFYPARSDKDRELRGEQDKNKTYAPSDQLGTGMALGTAMAISGAAANPSSGSHTAPQTAFLLTLFNVRLGWWVGNPANERTFRRPGPGVALFSLFSELFGTLDEGSDYLNLSDGGHFENLGLYELVRRRCRYIIAIDGEQDADYRFEALGGAVRKCRDDFGVDIVINPRPIQIKDGLSRMHCVVGRIYYPDSDYTPDMSTEQRPGWLLYIKASITGDEPADVEEYRREHPEFPQQSTVDQFFSESQFESYRMLGFHAGHAVLDRYRPNLELEESFKRLAARWEMPPSAPEGAFTRHAEAYSNLMARLAEHPTLNLDSQVVEGFPSPPSREAVFFWLELIQLAENIFVDLSLADKHIWEHPAYAGWRKIFEYWSGRPDLKKVWTTQAENYGKAFQDFFNDLIARNQ